MAIAKNLVGMAVAGHLGLNWSPAEIEWQRAQVTGPVKKPKLRSDEVKLKELLLCCRMANFREVRALVTHYPYLLALTDDFGFTALHHAEMSGDGEFMAKLLELYSDPRTFTRKFVRYETEEDLKADGLEVQGSCSSSSSVSTGGGSNGRGGPPSGRRPPKPAAVRLEESSTRSDEPVDNTVFVQLVAPKSIAAAAGVMPGDELVEVECAFVNGMRHQGRPVDILEAVYGTASFAEGFPCTLTFQGSACTEILGRDSWTPLHAAAGGGRHYKQVCQLLKQEQRKLPIQVHDAKGCTPEHWSLIHKRSISGPRRRPLSAGPCASRGTPAGAAFVRDDPFRAPVSRGPQLFPQAPPCNASIP